MTPKLIDTAAAGAILGINTHRIRTLIRKGYLKDHKSVNPTHKKHHPKLDRDEVKEFKRAYHILPREIRPKLHSGIHGNGNYVASEEPIIREMAQGKTAAMRAKPEPKVEPAHPVATPLAQSFGDRLRAIETKLDELIALWK